MTYVDAHDEYSRRVGISNSEPKNLGNARTILISMFLKVLQNRTRQPKIEPNRHRRWQKKVKPKASVRFRFSLPVSPEAFGFRRFHARDRISSPREGERGGKGEGE